MENLKDLFQPTATRVGVLRKSTAVCPEHGEYLSYTVGYRFENGDEKVTEPTSECPQCRAERNLREALRQDEQTRQEFEISSRLAKAKVPPLLEHASFEKFRIYHEDQSFAIEQLKLWVEGTHKNIHLLGPNGTGKTFLMISALREAILHRQGTALYITENHIIRRIRETYSGKKSGWTESQAVEFFGSVDLLAVDEIGRSNMSEDAQRIVMDIYDSRYLNKCRTILAGNINRDKMTDYYGEALMRRLSFSSALVYCDWPSWESWNEKNV